MTDKLLINGIVSTFCSSNKSDLLIKDNKIEMIQKNYTNTNSNENLHIFDCNGCYVIPGVIDTHVHLRDLNQSNKETIRTGSLAAIHGGITTVLSMPNTMPKISTMKVYDEYKKIIKLNSYVNIGLFCGIGDEFNLEILEQFQKNGIFGLKIYPGDSSKNFEMKWDYIINIAENLDEELNTDDFDLQEYISLAQNEISHNNSQISMDFENWILLFEKCHELKLPILLHPDIPIVKEKREGNFKIFKKNNTSNLKAHSKTFNKIHELLHNLFIFKILDLLGAKYKLKKNYKFPKLVFCHVSCPESVLFLETLKEMLIQKYSEIEIRLEITPHHLFLNYDISHQNSQYGKVLQPLRAEKDTKILQNLLKNNHFSFLATDHAPHTIEEKSLDFLKTPSGISGLDIYVLYFITKIMNNFMKIEDFVKFSSHNPAEFYKLEKKGDLKIGYIADIVVIEKTAPYSLKASDFYSKANFSPYDLNNIEAKIKYVFLNGELVIDGASKSKVSQENPLGTFIKKSNGN